MRSFLFFLVILVMVAWIFQEMAWCALGSTISFDVGLWDLFI